MPAPDIVYSGEISIVERLERYCIKESDVCIREREMSGLELKR